MRCLILFLTLLITTSRLVAANAIDRLQTDKDVEAFAKRVFRETYKNDNPILKVIPADSVRKNKKCDSIAPRWNGKTWQKADLNQDGKNDLLVLLLFGGHVNSFVFMDKGTEGFEIQHLNKSLVDDCEIANISALGTQPVVLMHYVKKKLKRNPFELIRHMQTDTLVYQFGGFTEYNPHPKTLSIHNLIFSTSACFGTCPVFKLTIQSNGKATYIAERYNPRKGKFKGVITDKQLKAINGLISYINIRRLQNEYNVPWTDDQTVNLKLIFSDGTSKSIEDYGLSGTFGLSHLYHLLIHCTNQPNLEIYLILTTLHRVLTPAVRVWGW